MSTCMPIPIRRLSVEAVDKNNVATSNLIDMVLLLAIKDRATDVLFEPRRDDYRLSYRCAGQDYEMVPPPRNRAGRISHAFKVLANLDIRNRRTLQEGRVRCLVDDEGADVLISIRPTRYGESVHVTIQNNTTKCDSVRQVLANVMSEASPPEEQIEHKREELEVEWTEPPKISMRPAEVANASFSHRLVLKGATTRGEWALEWDDVSFWLSDPHGILVLEVPPHHAGWCVDCFHLYESDEIWFNAAWLEFSDSSLANEFTPDRQQGLLKFKKNESAAKDLRTLFEQFVYFDDSYRRWAQPTAKWIATKAFGAVLSLLCLFVAMILWLTFADFPRPVTLASWQLMFVTIVGAFLLAIGGLGLRAFVVARRVLLRIRDVERFIARKAGGEEGDATRLGEPGFNPRKPN